MKVLVADDDPVVRTLVQRLLNRWEYDCVPASDGNEAWLKLQEPDAPSLVILDWEMPGMDGVTIASRLRTSRPEVFFYTLLLTSRGPDDIFEALTSGADDYLTKPFNPQELRARLHVGARMVGLRRELFSAYETAKYQASHDYLTGLLNRRLMITLAEREFERSERTGSVVAAILCDVDYFKLVNDTYGHSAGDKVLVEVAQRIRSATRGYDLIGRYGGEEFLVVVPDCRPEEVIAVAERIREAIGQEPIEIGQTSCITTMSIGVALSDPRQSPLVSVDELLAAADAAMYVAKQNGRNRCEVAMQGAAPGGANIRLHV
jgi:diguanylate cyclase (GGDEF)-like protein